MCTNNFFFLMQCKCFKSSVLLRCQELLPRIGFWHKTNNTWSWIQIVSPGAPEFGKQPCYYCTTITWITWKWKYQAFARITCRCILSEMIRHRAGGRGGGGDLPLNLLANDRLQCNEAGWPRGLTRDHHRLRSFDFNRNMHCYYYL